MSHLQAGPCVTAPGDWPINKKENVKQIFKSENKPAPDNKMPKY